MTDAYIDPSRANFDAFKSLDRDRPIDMLNLLRFRAHAAYPEGHALAGKGLSGAEAYAHYGADSGPVFTRVGGTMIWSGTPEAMVIGPEDGLWHAAFVARYPSAHAFLEMVSDPDYKLAVIHRQAAVETSRLIRHQPRDTVEGFG